MPGKPLASAQASLQTFAQGQCGNASTAQAGQENGQESGLVCHCQYANCTRFPRAPTAVYQLHKQNSIVEPRFLEYDSFVRLSHASRRRLSRSAASASRQNAPLLAVEPDHADRPARRAAAYGGGRGARVAPGEQVSTRGVAHDHSEVAGHKSGPAPLRQRAGCRRWCAPPCSLWRRT